MWNVPKPTQVRRFVRFNLGEGLEKKTSNLAAEVAEQTKAKEEEVKKAEVGVDCISSVASTGFYMGDHDGRGAFVSGGVIAL